mgnify:FL=1
MGQWKEMVFGKTQKDKNTLENGKLIVLMVMVSIPLKAVIIKVINVQFRVF